jgi:predicted dinucleotide-binding enzyme
MNIAILGTGIVGNTLGSKLTQSGHQVRMGSRNANNEKAVAWAQKAGAHASHSTYAEAAAFAEVVFNCTAGGGSLDALALAGASNLAGKILIDVANPLDFSKGMPPTLTVCNDDSLGERIQRAYPDTRVVKTLNTVTAAIMVEPALVPGDHNLFVCGNDAESKRQVRQWLTEWLGWSADNIVDLGDITTARGTEMYLALWIRMFAAMGSPIFNIRIVKGGAS